MIKIAPFVKRIIINLAAGLVTYFLLSGIIFKQEDYEWSIDMLEDNYDFVMNNGSMTLQERYASKLGVSFSLFDAVRSKTPDSAVIYLPGNTAFFPNNEESIFTGVPFEKMWATRFLYPRKVVTEREYGRSIYTDKIDYVMIVYGKGVERLKYALPYPLQFGVLYADSLQIKRK